MFDKDGGEAERWRGNGEGKHRGGQGCHISSARCMSAFLKGAGGWARCMAAAAWEEWEELWTKGEVPGISRLAPVLALQSLSGLLCEYKPGFWRAVG